MQIGHGNKFLIQQIFLEYKMIIMGILLTTILIECIIVRYGIKYGYFTKKKIASKERRVK